MSGPSRSADEYVWIVENPIAFIRATDDADRQPSIGSSVPHNDACQAYSPSSGSDGRSSQNSGILQSSSSEKSSSLAGSDRSAPVAVGGTWTQLVGNLVSDFLGVFRNKPTEMRPRAQSRTRSLSRSFSVTESDSGGYDCCSDVDSPCSEPLPAQLPSLTRLGSGAPLRRPRVDSVFVESFEKYRSVVRVVGSPFVANISNIKIERLPLAAVNCPNVAVNSKFTR